MTPEQERHLNRKGRVAGLVISGAMALWLIMQWLGPQLGIAGRYALLVDLAALAAFIWALIVTYQLWRARRDEG